MSMRGGARLSGDGGGGGTRLSGDGGGGGGGGTTKGGGATSGSARLLLVQALELSNCFAHTTYTPPDRARPLEHRLQLLLTLVGIAVTIALVSENLLVKAGRPLVESQLVAAPSPVDMASLFEQQAAPGGSVSSLSCACTRAAVALPNVSRWATPAEDSFCGALRAAATADGGEQLARLARDPANTACIGAPGEAAWDAFARDVEAAGRAAGLFPPAADDGALYAQFAHQWQSALCGLAFGTAPPASATADAGSAPSPHPRVVAPSDLVNRCHAPPAAATEERVMAPPTFARAASRPALLPLQQSRAFALLHASLRACGTLAQARDGLLEAFGAQELITPQALAPGELAAEVERAWDDNLAVLSSTFDTFVPGVSPYDDEGGAGGLAGATDVLPSSDSGADAYGGGGVDGGGALLRLPPLVSESAFPFSSRLPFVRADFVRGGAKRFYMAAVAGNGSGAVAVPLFAGHARVVARHAGGGGGGAGGSLLGGYPWLQTRPEHASPGFVPGAAAPAGDGGGGWVPLGDDFLSVLDACAATESGAQVQLAVDVHNLRPLIVTAAAAAAVASSGGGGGYEPPFASLAASAATNGGDSPPMCGFGQPVNYSAAAAPAAVLFSVPLRCPPLVTWLARLRRNSTYVARASRARFSVDAWVVAAGGGGGGGGAANTSTTTTTPAQAALLARAASGDLPDRLALLERLFMQDTPPVFEHSPGGHYAACRPRSCSYTSIKRRTVRDLGSEGYEVYGGTVTTTVSILAVVVLWVSFCRFQYGAWRERRRAQQQQLLEEELQPAAGQSKSAPPLSSGAAAAAAAGVVGVVVQAAPPPPAPPPPPPPPLAASASRAAADAAAAAPLASTVNVLRVSRPGLAGALSAALSRQASAERDDAWR